MEALATLILGLTNLAIDAWRAALNKPPGWEPTQEDWERLKKNNTLSADDYEKAEQVLDPGKQLPPQ